MCLIHLITLFEAIPIDCYLDQVSILYACQRLDIPEQLTKEVTESVGLKEEMKWAEKSVNLIGSDEEVHHTDDLRPKCFIHQTPSGDVGDKNPTINSILPLIKNASNDINFQAHFMNVTIQYTRYLMKDRGHWTALGCFDQPFYNVFS